MREYEVTIIVQPQLEEEARKEVIARVSGWLAPDADDDSKPVENHWGSRHLAYPIRNFTDGYYVMFDAKIDPQRISGIERNIRFNEDILRHLFVRKDEK